MASGYYTQGKLTEEFEQEFANYIGTRHAIMVNSGSSANLVAITAAYYASHFDEQLTHGKLLAGDEVVIPALCWPTTLTPILNQALRPVFCDVELDSLNLSVANVERVRSDRTRVIVAIPVLGNPSGLDELRGYCASENLILIEDSCESLGAVGENGRKVGAFGLAASFSFFFSHHISTVEGGCITTDSSLIADLCRALRAHGWTRHLDNNAPTVSLPQFEDADKRFEFFLPGYNVRTTEIAAALGRAQLEKFQPTLKSRKSLARTLSDALAPYIDRVFVPGALFEGGHSWMAFPMIFENKQEKHRVQRFLEDHGVETRPIIAGNIARHPLLRFIDQEDKRNDNLQNSDRILHTGMMLGLNPHASEEDQAYMVNILGSAMAGGR